MFFLTQWCCKENIVNTSFKDVKNVWQCILNGLKPVVLRLTNYLDVSDVLALQLLVEKE
jgi:hypothetical protein